MTELLLLLLLGSDGWVEGSAWYRQVDPLSAFGVQASAIASPEPGISVAATVTLRSDDVPRFGMTPILGLVAFDTAWPEGGSQLNALLALRLELAVSDCCVVMLEGRHVSNGWALLRHDYGNPGSDAVLGGIGWRF